VRDGGHDLFCNSRSTEAEKGVHGSGWYPEGSTARISADKLIEVNGSRGLKRSE